MEEMIKHMKEVLLADAIASELENEYQERDLPEELLRMVVRSQEDIMDTAPDFVREIGLDWDSEVAALDSEPYKKMIAGYDKLLGGKTTVEEMYSEFGDEIPYLLVMQSVGHGVGLDDNRAVTKFLKEKGVTELPHLYAERLSDYAHDAASHIIEKAVEWHKAQSSDDLEVAESALKAFKTVTG